MEHKSEGVDDYGWRSAKRGGHTAYTTPKILEILKQLKVKRLLDVGCGNGSLCYDLTQAGFDAVEVEYDAKGTEIARANYPGIHFYQ